MAIDTRRKRQNAAQVGCPLPVSILPSSIDAFARAQISWTYGGITINPPATGAGYEDRLQAGIQNAVTPREVSIGGFN